MSRVDAALEEVDELLRTVNPAEAERLLANLITALPPSEFHIRKADIRRSIESFLPKRRRALERAFDGRVRDIGELPEETAQDTGRVAPKATKAPEKKPKPASPPSAAELARRQAATAARQFLQRVNQELVELSDRHIFQWTTFYRETIGPLFDDATEAAENSDTRSALRDGLFEAFRAHSGEIFDKGYCHFIETGFESSFVGPEEKARNGLSAFLTLLVQIYSDALSPGLSLERACAIRTVASCMVGGALVGFAGVSFGPKSGDALLADSLPRWGERLPLLCQAELRRLAQELPRADMGSAVLSNLLPLSEAIDTMMSEHDGVPCLPAFVFYDDERHRLEVALRVGTNVEPLLKIHCYLASGRATIPQIAEGLRRGVALVIAPLEEGTSREIDKDADLSRSVIDTSVDARVDVALAVERTRSILRESLIELLGQHLPSLPIRSNVARNFPLRTPRSIQWYFVNRPAVQRLLQSCEMDSGVRLWCSVRRSGKTTACSELGSREDSVLVKQTCNSAPQFPEEGVFWQALDGLIRDSSELPRGFMTETMARCSGGETLEGRRAILLLDEYETMFDRLKLVARRDPETKVTIVQPLLDQLVDYASANLVILVGQRPDAHYIIMDQNPLSPYVRQDEFPLFEHESGSEHSEFFWLINKALSRSIEFDHGFADALYAETSGHPYLTVSLLVNLVDWLIERSYSKSDGPLSEETFHDFSKIGLSFRSIEANDEYRMFLHFFGQLIGKANTDDEGGQPWLHAVCMLLHRIGVEAPATLRISAGDAENILEEHGARSHCGVSPAIMLRDATMANFVKRTDRGFVTPRVRLMGRIAATV